MHPGEGAAGSEPSLGLPVGVNSANSPPLPAGAPGCSQPASPGGGLTLGFRCENRLFTQPQWDVMPLWKGGFSFPEKWPEAEACSLPPSLRFTPRPPLGTQNS